jgi:hypothetical protein
MGLDFYKDQFMFILGHKVNFAMAAAKVTFQDVISFIHQRFCCKAFTCAAQSLTRRVMCGSGTFFQETISLIR